MIQPKIAQSKTAPRTVASATRKRRSRAQRARYVDVFRVGTVLTLALVPVMLYVMLTANVTSYNYAIAHAEHERAELQDDVQRLDDRIAHLGSRERLAQVAAKLGMREPEKYAVVTLSEPVPRPKAAAGLAFLEWFKTP